MNGITNAVPDELLIALGFNHNMQFVSLAGNANDNFLLTQGSKKVVVKRLLEHSAKNTELESSFRDALSDEGLPVSRLIELSLGVHTLTVENGSYVAMDYVVGSTVQKLNIRQLSEIGGMLASTHNTSHAGLINRNNWLDSNYLHRTLSSIKSGHEELIQEILAAKKAYPDFWNSDLPTAIVHGDLHSGNTIIDQDGSIVSIIDWEETGIEPAVLDLAMTVKLNCVSGGELDNVRYTAFKDSYNSRRTLTEEELQHLEKAVNYCQLVESVWALAKHSSGLMKTEVFERIGYLFRQRIYINH